MPTLPRGNKDKQIHIFMTHDEWMKLRLVVLSNHTTITDFVMEMIRSRTESEIDRLNLRPAWPHRSQSAAPLSSAQK